MLKSLKMQYYFFLLALPPLSFKSRPEISFKEIMQMATLNLSVDDFEKVKQLLNWIDLYNIKALWMGLPLDDKGNFSEKELEELLLAQDESLPEYLLDFLDRYDGKEVRLSHFPSLFASLYQSGSEKKGFLGDYYRIERDTRLILTALRAKSLKRDLVRELQFEDPFDPLVSFILAQKDTTDFTPPVEYEELRNLFVENHLEPEKLHRSILEYRLNKIEELEETTSFSIDQVLSYIAQFLIVDGWFHLNKEKGQIAVEELSHYG
jgi:hypothetical protein